MSVESDTPATGAGLLVGDIILGIEGTPIEDADDLQAALAPERVGTAVRLQLLRGGAAHEVTATLAERA